MSRANQSIKFWGCKTVIVCILSLCSSLTGWVVFLVLQLVVSSPDPMCISSPTVWVPDSICVFSPAVWVSDPICGCLPPGSSLCPH